MTYKEDLLQEEIQLADDECCIVFDFGCYFPYTNPEILTFDFSLGSEEFTDYKKNHRYPNKGFQTISKKYGRKVSKLGYPYILKISEQSPMLLCIKVGIGEQFVTMIFPVLTDMTKEKPICNLSFHFDFDKSEFSFISLENIGEGSWTQHIWHNYEDWDIGTQLNSPHELGEGKYTLIYEDIITPFSQPLAAFMLVP